MAKAPLEVVTEIRERLAVTTAEIERLEALLAALPLDASRNSTGSDS